MKPVVILFDVNETLLDMLPLKTKVNSLFKNENAFRIWFGMLLHYSLVDNCTGHYHDFVSIANATLDMSAEVMQVSVNNDEKNEALSTIKKLASYPDVKPGLTLLKQAGFRLATLTNSPMPTLIAQLEYAGLTTYFEEMLSIDSVKKYKPAPETYQFAAQKLGVNTNEILMVAAHGWDINGALKAGMQGAFIEREGQSLYSLSPQPGYIAKDLIAFANTII
jgi:2-haloacid dehalogenase